MKVSTAACSDRRLAAYSSEATAINIVKNPLRQHYKRENAAHRLSKCTVCVSPTTDPTRAARATTEVERANFIVEIKMRTTS